MNAGLILKAKVKVSSDYYAAGHSFKTTNVPGSRVSSLLEREQLANTAFIYHELFLNKVVFRLLQQSIRSRLFCVSHIFTVAAVSSRDVNTFRDH